MCRFDRNEFGQFLGSATVTYERHEDAKRAISEYHGAFLDDKVLTVEFDMVPGVARPHARSNDGPQIQHRNNSSGKGKTLRVK